MGIEITETDEGTLFTMWDDNAICPKDEDGSHDIWMGRPTIKDGPEEDGDWEVVFPFKCRLCGITGTSECAASDGFLQYDEPTNPETRS